MIEIQVYDIDRYRVGNHDVDLTPGAELCHCGDHQYRGRLCKHGKRAMEIRQQLNAALDALPPMRE